MKFVFSSLAFFALSFACSESLNPLRPWKESHDLPIVFPSNPVWFNDGYHMAIGDGIATGYGLDN
jgi:hypothetical protein